MIRLLTILLLLIGCASAKAATYTAANTTIGAVSNALALCAAVGDIVEIPAGNASWTNGLYITNAVRIRGAGRGLTVISNAISGAEPVNTKHVFSFNLLSHNSTSYIGGLTICDDPSQTLNIFNFGVQVEGDNKDGRRMVVTNIHFYGIHSFALRIESALGVVSRCQFDEPFGGVGVYGFHRTWNGYSYGHGSWSTNVPSGSDQMWYIEDCGFNSLQPGVTYTTIDGYGGWRYCIRYSNLTNQTAEGHGYESGESRGTRYVEGYMNTFYSTNGGQIATFLRSAEQIYFSNTMVNLSGTTPFKLLVDRMDDELTVIGGANGRNPFDSNTTAVVTGTASSAGTLTLTDSGKSWTTDQWVGYTVRRTSGVNVSSLTRSGSTITLDTSGAHGIGAGINVTVCGANEIGYNGTYSAAGGLVSVTDSDTLSLTTFYTPASPATGTMFIVTNNSFGRITANTATQLTFSDSIYGNAARAVFHAGDTYEISLVRHAVDQPGAGVSTVQTASPPSTSGWSQQLAICYEWGNTNESGTAVHFSPSMPQIVAGVHYTNAVKAGYSPYTYPHPLLAASGGASGSISLEARGPVQARGGVSFR